MVTHYPNLKVSESDKNKYKAFKLDNGLMVYLIQNKEAEKAAASLVCHIGSLRDPRDHQGLAHFLEHMLFIGSEKYPGESDYMNFLGQNGGYSNAYTSQFVTNYHFEVKDDKLLKALDMFAQFFISPLFKEESVFKEINAVNSEAELYLNNDNWRRYHIEALLANPKSEASKYNVGNLDTLGNLRGHIPLQSDKDKAKDAPPVQLDPAALERKNQLVQALKQFHKRYYSANQMSLAIYTKGDLDALEPAVTEIFSGILNTNIEYQGFKNEVAAYPPENLSKFVKMKAINKGSTLRMSFILPEMHYDKFNKSGNYLSHLIGHESEGSILELLAEEGLALELSSSFDREEEFYSNLNISIKLTKEGATKEGVRKVISAVGAYINMLAKEGPQEWVYDEIRNQNLMSFKFQDTTGGVGKCIGVANGYLEYNDPENSLFNAYDYRKFCPETITKIVQQLNAEHLHIMFISDELKEVESFSTDPIYSTRYLIEPIRADVADVLRKGDVSWSKLKSKIHLPEKNSFLPTVFDLKQNPTQAPCCNPQRIREVEESTCWHWQDTQFHLPKSKCAFTIFLDPGLTMCSAKFHSLLTIYTMLLKDQTRSLSYMAEMAKIQSSIITSNFGLEVNITCFDQSLHPYLLKLLAVVFKFHETGPDPVKFESNRDNVENLLLKGRNDAPFRFLFGDMADYLTEGLYNTEESLQAIKSVNFEDMQEYMKHMYSRVRFEWLIEGNTTAQEAIAICTEAENAFKGALKFQTLPKELVNQSRIIILEKGATPVVELVSKVTEEKNCGFFKVYQISNNDTFSPVINVLTNWIKSPYFENLRTQQQLGYAVFALPRVFSGVRFFGFCIQSDVKSTHFCISRTLAFLDEMKKELAEMTEEKFREICSGVIASMLEPNKTLAEKFSEDWAEIKNHQFKFGRRQWIAEEVKALTIDKLRSFYDDIFYANPRSFELHLYSHANQKDSIAEREARQGVVVYSSAEALKKAHGLFADTYSRLE